MHNSAVAAAAGREQTKWMKQFRALGGLDASHTHTHRNAVAGTNLGGQQGSADQECRGLAPRKSSTCCQARCRAIWEPERQLKGTLSLITANAVPKRIGNGPLILPNGANGDMKNSAAPLTG